MGACHGKKERRRERERERKEHSGGSVFEVLAPVFEKKFSSVCSLNVKPSRKPDEHAGKPLPVETAMHISSSAFLVVVFILFSCRLN